jgi:hypothetical protein
LIEDNPPMEPWEKLQSALFEAGASVTLGGPGANNTVSIRVSDLPWAARLLDIRSDQ